MPPHTRIRDIDKAQRPRERLGSLGVHALSDAELLAIQLGVGTREASALALAQDLLAEWGGVAGLARARPADLARTRGIGAAKAARIASAFTLADRAGGLPGGSVMKASSDAAAIAAPRIGRDLQEQVMVIVADGRARVRHTEVLARGGASRCATSVREVLATVLRHDGVAFALAHNHPSGDPTPSRDDLDATERMRDAAAAVGLRLLDHVVVAGDAWRSATRR